MVHPHGAQGLVIWNAPLIDDKKVTPRSSNVLRKRRFLITELVQQEIRIAGLYPHRRLTS
jgi:hypothetical protein